MGTLTVKNSEKLCPLCGMAWRNGQSQNCYDCGRVLFLFLKFGTGQVEAVQAVKKEIKEGRMKPASEFLCVDCGKQAEHYEHRDYNHPLDVVPTCRSCNFRRGHAIPKLKPFAEFVSYALGRPQGRRLAPEHFEPIRRKYWPNEK